MIVSYHKPQTRKITLPSTRPPKLYSHLTRYVCGVGSSWIVPALSWTSIQHVIAMISSTDMSKIPNMEQKPAHTTTTTTTLSRKAPYPGLRQLSKPHTRKGAYQNLGLSVLPPSLRAQAAEMSANNDGGGYAHSRDPHPEREPYTVPTPEALVKLCASPAGLLPTSPGTPAQA